MDRPPLLSMMVPWQHITTIPNSYHCGNLCTGERLNTCKQCDNVSLLNEILQHNVWKTAHEKSHLANQINQTHHAHHTNQAHLTHQTHQTHQMGDVNSDSFWKHVLNQVALDCWYIRQMGPTRPLMHFDVSSLRSYRFCVGQCRNFALCPSDSLHLSLESDSGFSIWTVIQSEGFILF